MSSNRFNFNANEFNSIRRNPFTVNINGLGVTFGPPNCTRSDCTCVTCFSKRNKFKGFKEYKGFKEFKGFYYPQFGYFPVFNLGAAYPFAGYPPFGVGLLYPNGVPAAAAAPYKTLEITIRQ